MVDHAHAAGPETPVGAIENGREYFRRLIEHYDFECPVGPLRSCMDFEGAKTCFEHLVEHIRAIETIHCQLHKAAGDILPHVSAETEQRKFSGHDEDWAELEAAEDRLISALNQRARRNTVVGEVAIERQRQIDEEGWAPEHDDEQVTGELAKAACCYAWAAAQTANLRRCFEAGQPPPVWPDSWDTDWWKPTTRRRDLVKAAALIAAEIERLDRIDLMQGGDDA